MMKRISRHPWGHVAANRRRMAGLGAIQRDGSQSGIHGLQIWLHLEPQMGLLLKGGSRMIARGVRAWVCVCVKLCVRVEAQVCV